jgi:hypothetical protein
MKTLNYGEYVSNILYVYEIDNPILYYILLHIFYLLLFIWHQQHGGMRMLNLFLRRFFLVGAKQMFLVTLETI